MKFAYKFSNLLGSVYTEGNLLFTSDGNSIISPVGNRITIFDLKNNKSLTLPIESRYNYNALDLSPSGHILIAINEEGEANIISMVSKIIIHRHRFKQKVKFVKFSPNGKHIAIGKENTVFIFSAPGEFVDQYNPFIMERVFHDAINNVSCLQWSYDSKLLAVGSKDASTRLYCLEKFTNCKKYMLGNHSDSIIGCFFEKNNYDILTVSRNGQLCLWECSIEPSDFIIESSLKKLKYDEVLAEDDIDSSKAVEITEKDKKKINFFPSMEFDTLHEKLIRNTRSQEQQFQNKDFKKFKYKKLGSHYLADELKKSAKDAVLTAVSYHQKIHILVAGFSNGYFFLYEIPEVNVIQSLRISTCMISSITLNVTGDWIAIGCKEMGQLLVWEWQSETYAMKQQSHSSNINCIAFSADGQLIASGGDDGKLKLWNASSGFCNVTFHEHTSSISGILFSKNRKFVISASLDGTLRAYDLMRYRNFKTFTSPRPVQFACVTLDSSDQFLAAGGQDVFEIFLWSVKLGTLLEILSGHEAPVRSLAFNPNLACTELASVSWDKTLKIWSAIESGSSHETVQLTADGLCVVYKPNGEEVAVATLDGQISFFNCKTATQLHLIEGRKDLGGGRLESDIITAKKSLVGKAFTSLSYSADGNYILAGGQSKNVCIYHIQERILLKKFEITQNRSLDAVDDFINRRKLTEFGNINLVEKREKLEGSSMKLRLPGVKKEDLTNRSVKPDIRVFSLQFSPTGQAWCAASTEGLLIYSLDTKLVFDPFQLEIGITPSTIKNYVAKQEYSKAIMSALKLSERSSIRQSVENVPRNDVALILRSVPDIYIEKLLKFIATELEVSQHLHFYLLWLKFILFYKNYKKSSTQMPTILLLEKNIRTNFESLSKICDYNQYTIFYIKKHHKLKTRITSDDFYANTI